MMFGFVTIILLTVIGGAVDFARWHSARAVTVGAVDAAVLAAARVLHSEAGDATLALAAASEFYRENVRERTGQVNDTINFKIVDGGTAVTADGAADLDTVLLKLIGIDKVPLFKASGAEFSKARLAVGSFADQTVEISMMLDITGSMAGQKLADLKTAAKDLVDVVVWKSQGANTAKVALVPFSAAVNVGAFGSELVSGGQATQSVRMADGRTRTLLLNATCAAERIGPDAFTDAKPTAQSKLSKVYSASGGCQPTNPVVPLTNDKQHLMSTIDAFTAIGSTAGHLGTAWAWYTLSPNWAEVFPANSRPAAYELLSQTNADGKPKLAKIAILMSDGEYNMQYCETGVRDSRSNGIASDRGACVAPNGSSTVQARALCAGMKAKGITVYTVGFQIPAGSEAAETLRLCATSDQNFYIAEDGEALKQSFRNIALKVTDIYLTR
ncbi:MAG: VWA domain-containing protein [Hyphomicrobiaceae bacterium]|nr:VWA domain-containing protein [Hyphomicrobiaceae bacterium]